MDGNSKSAYLVVASNYSTCNPMRPGLPACVRAAMFLHIYVTSKLLHVTCL